MHAAHSNSAATPAPVPPALAPGQVSFVNAICTTKGGTHVNYLASGGQGVRLAPGAPGGSNAWPDSSPTWQEVSGSLGALTQASPSQPVLHPGSLQVDQVIKYMVELITKKDKKVGRGKGVWVWLRKQGGCVCGSREDGRGVYFERAGAPALLRVFRGRPATLRSSVRPSAAADLRSAPADHSRPPSLLRRPPSSPSW